MDRKLLLLALLFSLLAGCDDSVPEPPSGDDGKVPGPEIQSPETRSQAGQADKEQTNQNLDLSLDRYPAGTYPVDTYPVEGVEKLFAGGDEPDYDFFQSREKDKSVRLKGKLYLKEEVSPEQRLDNLDGGEVEVQVPLK